MTKKKAETGGAATQSNAAEKPFTPEVLDRSLVAIPLLNMITKKGGASRKYHVIIDLNMDFAGQAPTAKETVIAMLRKGSVAELKTKLADHYVFAELTGREIQSLASAVEAASAGKGRGSRPIYRIWHDQEVKLLTNASLPTIKASAAHNAFAAYGEGICWAVADSGIDRSHPHFEAHKNLDLELPLRHADFSKPMTEAAGEASACLDPRGHGTHVAGIIAGQVAARQAKPAVAGAAAVPALTIRATTRRRDEQGQVVADEIKGLDKMSGVAPRAKLLSLKVLDDRGGGLSSNLIAAIAYIQKLNDNGRRLRVQGLNMSVGYDFDPEWFACGQSPLCVEVDRLVKSGVSVVVAAGNTGYGWVQLSAETARNAGLDLTINDPGNAELAVTVGSTHRDMPHVYGVSYFSSKGPTGDGRLKPDLVAPGEKIISCQSSQSVPEVPGEADPDAAGPRVAHYKEDSGTSMAAPHVSGAIAAFLSVRREFIGQPEKVKDIILKSATDLRRDRHFQGAGLVDLMRALQSV